MKRLFLTFVCLVFSVALSAQGKGAIIVDSEQIFKSVASYNEAISTLDALAEQYQTQVDNEYAAIEAMYNDYQAKKAYLSASARSSSEEAIISREKQAAQMQENLFGAEGSLIKKRIELIKPIQEAIFAVIKNYALTNGYDLVVDSANNSTLLYVATGADKTRDIIRIINQ